MDYQHESKLLLAIVERGTAEQLFTFLQGFHRKPFQNLNDVITYNGVIDDQIDFIDCTGTKYNITPLIITAGKGSYEKTKILLVHGANPNKQCATGDTALNLAIHRQKYVIVELLLQYCANPNLYNQFGKTALHRAVVSYTNENIDHFQTLLDAGADPNIQDRNQRLPLDEAVIANKPDMMEVLLSHDRTLVQRAYRAAIIASRLGHNKCLITLFNHGMDPNITDQTQTTPLHVAVRSLKLSTVQLLIANGANQNIANNRYETALSIAEQIHPDQRPNFMNILVDTPPTTSLKSHTSTIGKNIENIPSNIYPLLHNHKNWTMETDEYRSQTAETSSVQNLLDVSIQTYWCSTQSNNAWVIYDFKHEHNINGIRIIGCGNPSTPKNGHIDVSNALNGPWLKVKDFTCLPSEENKNDFFFPSLITRFIRVFILDNYGGDDIRIQGIAFFGVDMRLVNLLQEYGLENKLNTLLRNGINDPETLDENRDEILNSSDKYLHVNDHFQLIHLTESLKSPQLTFLEWHNPPQTTVIAGEKLQTFSVVGDEGITDRVKLEEQLENNSQTTTILMKDLEPIQGRSLVDFPDYIIKYPGRYKIRVVSIESPNIHTSWQEIIVDPPYYFSLTKNSYTTVNSQMSYNPQNINNHEHFHPLPSTDEDDNDCDSHYNSRLRKKKILTPSKYRSGARTPLSNISPTNNFDNQSEQSDEEEPIYVPRCLTPTKYRRESIRNDALHKHENIVHSQQYGTHDSQFQNPNQRERQHQLSTSQRFDVTTPPPQDQRPYERQRSPHEQNGSYSQMPYATRPAPPLPSSSSRNEYIGRTPSEERNDSVSQAPQNTGPSPYEPRHEQQTTTQEGNDSYSQMSGTTRPPQSQYSSEHIGQSSSGKQNNSVSKRPPAIDNTDQDHLKPFLNQYKVISGDMEFIQNLSNHSSHTDEYKPEQMQFIFKGTVQGSAVQERARQSMQDIAGNRSRTPTLSNNIDQNQSHPSKKSALSAADADQLNQNTTSLDDGQSKLKGESDRRAGLNSSSKANRLPSAMAPDSDDDTYSVPSNNQQKNQSVSFNEHAPSDQITSKPNKHADGEFPQSYYPSSSIHTSSKQHVNHAPDPKKYFFGSSTKHQLSDNNSDSDEESIAIGHSHQELLANSNTQPSRNYPDNTYHDYIYDDRNADDGRFAQQSDVATTTNDTPTNTTTRRYMNLSNGTNENITNSIILSNRIPPQYHADNNYSKTDISSTIQPNRSSERYEQIQNNENQGPYEMDNNSAIGSDDPTYRNDINVNGNETDDYDISTSVHRPPQVDGLVRPNPVYPALKETESNESMTQSYSSTAPVKPKNKEKQGFISKILGKKPPEITLRTGEGQNLYTHGIIQLRPHSPPTTDITDEITKQDSFDKRYTSFHTPDPYLYNLRDTYEGNEENLDPMPDTQQYNRSAKAGQQIVAKNHRTQTEIRSTRNVGTMCELSKANIVNNGILSQQYKTHRPEKLHQHTVHDPMINGHDNLHQTTSSSHQHQPSNSSKYDPMINGHDKLQQTTSSSHQHQPSHSSKYDSMTNGHGNLQQTTSSTHQHQPSNSSKYDPVINGHDKIQQTTSSSHQHPRSRSSEYDPYIFGQLNIIEDDNLDRTSNSQNRQYPPRPSRRSPPRTPPSSQIRPLSPPQRSHSSSFSNNKPSPRKTKPRTPTATIETDTSLDGMKHPVHVGVQSDPPSTKHKRTSIHAEELPLPQNIYPTTTHPKRTNSSSTQNQDNLIDVQIVSPKQKDDQNRTPTKGHLTNYEEKKTPKGKKLLLYNYNLVYNQLTIYFSDTNKNNYNQYEDIPFEQVPNKKEKPYVLRHSYIQELPSSSTTLIPTDVVHHSSTSHQNQKAPARPQPIHYAEQKQIPPVTEPRPLHFGTQNIITHPPNNEVATPIEKEIIYERNRSFTFNNHENLNSKKRPLFLMPVINSSRTYVVEKQTPPDNTIRKSRINRNFFLANPPTLRPLRKTYQSVDSGIDQSAHIHDSNDFFGQNLGTQVV
ncbi:unnamed protein product [Adineta steineri]|uniref:F5/8 type C domain-containing protein n=1 Tax=Adineta steineri TaxID=433720 RepID=A0A814YHA5_9BILA|nr:unnamed protein product [Adineta steineri]